MDVFFQLSRSTMCLGWFLSYKTRYHLTCSYKNSAHRMATIVYYLREENRNQEREGTGSGAPGRHWSGILFLPVRQGLDFGTGLGRSPDAEAKRWTGQRFPWHQRFSHQRWCVKPRPLFRDSRGACCVIERFHSLPSPISTSLAEETPGEDKQAGLLTRDEYTSQVVTALPRLIRGHAVHHAKAGLYPAPLKGRHPSPQHQRVQGDSGRQFCSLNSLARV